MLGGGAKIRQTSSKLSVIATQVCHLFRSLPVSCGIWIGAAANRFGGEARLDWQSASWLYLTFGAEGTFTNVEAENFFGSESGIEPEATHDLTDLALYAQGEFVLTAWVALTAGARLDVGGFGAARYPER